MSLAGPSGEGSVWMGNPRDNTVLGWFLFSGLKIVRYKSILKLVMYIGEEEVPKKSRKVIFLSQC